MNDRNPIMPEHYMETQNHIEIKKPDLLQEKYLQSKHTTPAESLE
jgi:hypothetical protein